MLFVHMLAVEKHTFASYKKLPEEMEIYKRHLQENNMKICFEVSSSKQKKDNGIL